MGLLSTKSNVNFNLFNCKVYNSLQPWDYENKIKLYTKELKVTVVEKDSKGTDWGHYLG